MTQTFIHLRTHTEYSIKDGIVRIEDYVKCAGEFNMPAIAITDHTNLFGLVKFFRKAMRAGIKPIIGADVLLWCEDEITTCTLLCKNQQGYQNLTTLLSRAYTEERHDHQALVDWSWLQSASEGLIILSGGFQGDIGKALLQGNKTLASKRLARWMKTFPDHFYLELSRCERENEEDYLHLAYELAKKHAVPVVATNDIRFIKSEDFEAHEARVCIHDGYVLDDEKRPHAYSEQQYMKSSEQMQALFSDIPEAIINTTEIATRCNVMINLGEVYLPKFPTPNHEREEDYFKEQASLGLKQRLEKAKMTGTDKIKEYQSRLNHELDVIIKMGFPGYFLIVADFIDWAKKNDIPVGPGRGSGAGSLVAYSLGITELDPLSHELLFERFLNSERISMPDFDVDFCMDGRDRVIEYVAERYGHDAVAQIITYGTMAAKAVVRDVGRVLGLPYGFCDKIAKLIPFELGITLTKALEQEEVLKQRYEAEEEVKTLIDLSLKLEGITRNAGKHAGGVVIAPTKLTDFVPLYCEENSEQAVTQFDKDDVEAVGLVKFDFLGLRTLTIINWALKTINQKQSTKIDISDIPLGDKKTFALLKKCATTAVFQLESRGMKELIRRLQPDSFEDITALVALFRPGPLQSGMVDDFIDRKHGRARVNYLHPSLSLILAPTYGVILYQEQVMQIARVLSGYTLGEADILRRIMGKKKPEEMAKQRSIFVNGAKNNGIDEKKAEIIFDLVEKFAGYGFNKSHSAAYALIAYQTAWLKAHYPAEFMAAVLSSDMDNTDKVVAFIDECKSMQLTVRVPAINEGFYQFTVNQSGEIIYGLGAIKGVGEALIQHLVDSRCEHGEFNSLFDICARLDNKKLTRRAIEPLIKSGSFDQWKIPRSHLLASVDKALRYAEQKRRNETQGQRDLFSDGSQEDVTYEKTQAWTELDRLEGEKATLGLYVSGHPLDTCQKELAHFGSTKINRLNLSDKTAKTIVGIVINLRVITTRMGKRMAIMTLEDASGRIEVTLFSEIYQQIAEELESSTIFLIKGSVSKDDYTGGIKMVADGIMSLESARERMARLLNIIVNNSETVDKLLNELPELVKQHGDGCCPIKIIYQTKSACAELKLGDAWRVKPGTALLNELYHLCGRDNVCLEYH